METRQDIAYLSDLGDTAIVPSQAVQGNIVLFGDDNVLQDSGKKPSDYPDLNQAAEMIATSVGLLRTAVNGEYAISAYKSDAWAQVTPYFVGDFCMYLGTGYRCIEEHVSGIAFDGSKWQAVLSPEGKAALDLLLADYPKDGLAKLDDIAPAMDPETEYAVGQLVVEDEMLNICTRAGRGAAAQFEKADVEQALALIRNGLEEIAEEISRVEKSIKQADWDESDSSDPAFIRNKPKMPSGQVQADWDEESSTDPAFIRNKPEMPGDVRYRIVYRSPQEKGQGLFEVQIEDRAVNVVYNPDSSAFKLVMVPPQRAIGRSRDFYVVLNSGMDPAIRIEMQDSTLENCEGKQVTIVAPDEDQATYRFTEIYVSAGDVPAFVVSMYADPANGRIQEAEKAMDDILNNEGVATFTPGVFLPEDGTNKYYRISAVKESWGEVVVGISQHGTPYGDGGVNPDGSDSSSNSSSDDGSSDPAQNVILELASRNYVDRAIDDVYDLLQHLFDGETISAYPTQAQIADVVKRLFELFGGTVQ